jgi:hypothetical protein
LTASKRGDTLFTVTNVTKKAKTGGPPIFDLRREMEELLKKHPGPAKKETGAFESARRQVSRMAPPGQRTTGTLGVSYSGKVSFEDIGISAAE